MISAAARASAWRRPAVAPPPPPRPPPTPPDAVYATRRGCGGGGAAASVSSRDVLVEGGGGERAGVAVDEEGLDGVRGDGDEVAEFRDAALRARDLAGDADERGAMGEDVVAHLGVRAVAEGAERAGEVADALLARVAVVRRGERVGVEVLGVRLHPRLEVVANLQRGERLLVPAPVPRTGRARANRALAAQARRLRVTPAHHAGRGQTARHGLEHLDASAPRRGGGARGVSCLNDPRSMRITRSDGVDLAIQIIVREFLFRISRDRDYKFFFFTLWRATNRQQILDRQTVYKK